MTVLLIFHCFFVLWPGLSFVYLFVFFNFHYVGPLEWKNPQVTKYLFLLISSRSVLITGFKWSVCISKSPRNFIRHILPDKFYFAYLSLVVCSKLYQFLSFFYASDGLLSNLDGFRDGRSMAAQLLLCGMLPPRQQVSSCHQNSFQYSGWLGSSWHINPCGLFHIKSCFYTHTCGPPSHTCPLIHTHCPIGLMGRAFTSGPGDRGSISGQVIPKSYRLA